MQGDSSQGDLDVLIASAVQKTERMLLWLSYRRNYRVRDLGFSVKDIAYDIVAELFSGEEEQCCARLKASLTEANPADDDAVLSAFDSILFKNVHQHLPRIFGEINPLFQHLLRALRGHIYRSTDVRTLERLDGKWYCHRDTPEADLARPVMPFELLRLQLRLESGGSSTPVAEVFRSVLASLREQSEYRPAVLESDILQLTREALGMDYSFRTETHADPAAGHDAQVLGRILLQALDSTLPWIEEVYIGKRHLSKKEVDCILTAIRMYFNDLMSEQDALGPYTYLRRCMPGLTHDRFRRSYRRKFEYILQRILDEAYIRLGKDSTLLR
jgi:hypothetical protein